jgi:hypothetical protein
MRSREGNTLIPPTRIFDIVDSLSSFHYVRSGVTLNYKD